MRHCIKQTVGRSHRGQDSLRHRSNRRRTHGARTAGGTDGAWTLAPLADGERRTRPCVPSARGGPSVHQPEQLCGPAPPEEAGGRPDRLRSDTCPEGAACGGGRGSMRSAQRGEHRAGPSRWGRHEVRRRLRPAIDRLIRKAPPRSARPRSANSPSRHLSDRPGTNRLTKSGKLSACSARGIGRLRKSDR